MKKECGGNRSADAFFPCDAHCLRTRDSESFGIWARDIRRKTSLLWIKGSSFTQDLWSVTQPPREGVRRQDQFERFSVKREHNQHTIVQYHIMHSSKSYYNLGSRISYTKRFEVKTTLQRLIRVCGSDFSHDQDISFCPKRECHPSAF
jgi:hypothetical protein